MTKKTIVIAGGTRGIGKAILMKFASQGFRAIACSRSAQNLAALEAEFQADYPHSELHLLAADLSQKSDAQRFADFVRTTVGSRIDSTLDGAVDGTADGTVDGTVDAAGLAIDVLVNNVGLFIPGQVCDEPDGNLERMMQTNLYSAYYLTRGLIDLFLTQKQGHIFNLCSVASLIPYPKGSSYGITKFALLGFSKVLREELKPHNVKVTAILPSATLTDSWQGTDLPPDRFIKPEDVADLVYACYALSPQCVPEEILLRPQAGDIL